MSPSRTVQVSLADGRVLVVVVDPEADPDDPAACRVITLSPEEAREIAAGMAEDDPDSEAAWFRTAFKLLDAASDAEEES